MKKVLAIFLMVLMVACMSITAFATPGEFVQSPSNNGAPELVSAECGAEGCTAKLVITPFIDRDELPADLKALIEKAYKDIANCASLTDLCSELAATAKSLNVPETNLAVSDLFDIRYIKCEEHEEHGYFDIVIKADTFKNFVALMHLSADDGWELINNAKVSEVNGEYHLTFSVDDFSPFAVVVNSAVITDKNPHTGDTNTVYFFAVLMAVSAFAVVVLLKKNKKQAV